VKKKDAASFVNQCRSFESICRTNKKNILYDAGEPAPETLMIEELSSL
jgi:hypothetical protein